MTTVDWRTLLGMHHTRLAAPDVAKEFKVAGILDLCADADLVAALVDGFGEDPGAVSVALLKLGGICHGATKAAAALQKTVTDAARKGKGTPRMATDAPARPRVRLLPNSYDTAQAVLRPLKEGGRVYQRAQSLVYVRRDGREGHDLQEAPDIRVFTPAGLGVEINRMADTTEFKPTRGGGVEEVMVRCPEWVPPAVMGLSEWPFPVLEGVSRVPIFRPDGSIVTTPGYDDATGYLYEPHAGLTLNIPEVVTQEMAAAAARRLLDPFVDFPFGPSVVGKDGQEQGGPAYRAGILASILSVIARPGIRGPVPMFVFSATTPKSGKTLVISLVYMITTGEGATVIAPVEREEEMEKRITSIMMGGKPVVLIDNVVRIGGPSLDAALTAYPKYAGRILGTSTMPEVPAYVVWFTSGNSIIFEGDIFARIIPIQLEPDCEHPENRTGFRYARVLEHVRMNRANLLADAYTLLRGYVQAGRPMAPLKPMGCYEAWTDVVRQTIVWAGQTDPFNAVASYVVGADEKKGATTALLRAWFDKYGPATTYLATLAKYTDAEKAPELWHALQPMAMDRDGRLSTTKLGHYLRRCRGRIYGGLRIDPVEETSNGSVGWRVTNTIKAAPGGEAEKVVQQVLGVAVPPSESGRPVFEDEDGTVW